MSILKIFVMVNFYLLLKLYQNYIKNFEKGIETIKYYLINFMLWDKLSNFASNFTKLNNKLHKKMSKKNKQVEVNEFDETIAASKSFFEKYQKQRKSKGIGRKIVEKH